MFSKVFPKSLPSTWRLGLLIGLLQVGSVALCIVIASWTMQRDLGAVAAAVVMDDLGEYAALYSRNGIDTIRAVFVAGKHEGDQGVRITKPDGSVLFEAIPDEMKAYPWPAQPPLMPHSSMMTLRLRQDDGHQELLVGVAPLNDGNAIWFGRTNAEDVAYVANIRRNLWIAGVLAMVLALLPLWWFANHVLRPVAAMVRSVRSLGQGRTDTRIDSPTGVPELQAFASAFNEGLDRIEGLTEELQRANDQLAHELRTPLARIRGNLEVFHDHVDQDIARDAAARGLDEIDRAAKLINTILTTRAGEHRALKLHLEVIDVREMLKIINDLYLPAADERDLRLVFEASETRMVLLDRERITQAVANLLDNAFSYTPRFGQVTLAMEVREHCVRLIVRDTGPGVRPHESEQIWMRHVRGSAASAKTPGMGLGLSLVRAIATAHDGTTGCANREEGGAEFWIELPGDAGVGIGGEL